MPGILRSLLGFIILVVTIGLATCQAMVKAEPSSYREFEGPSTRRLQAE